MVTGSFLGVKRQERCVDHPPHLAPTLKEEQSYTCTSEMRDGCLCSIPLQSPFFTILPCTETVTYSLHWLLGNRWASWLSVGRLSDVRRFKWHCSGEIVFCGVTTELTFSSQVVMICTVQWSLYISHSDHYMYRTVVTICIIQWSLYVPPV